MDLTKLQIGLIQLPRQTKRAIMLLSDAALVAAALAGALLLVHPTSPYALTKYWPLFTVAVAVAIPVFAHQGLYRAIVKPSTLPSGTPTTQA